jgi:cytochrome c-type biogenesis protein CcmF
MTPGNLTLKLATVLCVVAFVSALRWARGHEASERVFRWSYQAMTVCLAFASTLLMMAILVHDFRFDYVIGYSSRDLPLLYLISSFWAGQQGTFLLWALLAALVGYPLFRKGGWEPAAVATAYLPTVGFLLVLMLDPGGNPFRLAQHVPPDGRGLNMLLQDPWMASHPPLVFLGYAAMAVPAALAMVSLFKRRDDGWLVPALRWSLLAYLGLGAGIVLGGFWAYKVLGWGGYWGWDPVENASLVPWLAVTALIHGLVVQKGSGALRRSNWILALAGYVLVLYATFLTRSGVLADFSVHSFPAGTIFRLLVGVLLVTLAASIWGLARRFRSRGSAIETAVSWPLVISVAVGLFIASGLFVLIGTSWPMISTWFGTASSMGPPFYNRVSLPLYITLFGLLAVAPFLGWRNAPARAWLVRVVPALVAATVGTAGALALGARGVGALALFFVAVAALTSNIIRFAQVARARLLFTGAALAHIGFALMFVGIVASSAWGVTERVDLPLGRPVEAVDRILTFRGHVDGSEPQDRWRVAVQRPGEAETPTFVGMFMIEGNGGEDQVFRRPAILRSVAGDLYVAPLGLDESGAGAKTVDLARGEPAPYGEGSLTFLGFETEQTESGHGMTFTAHVEVRRGEEREVVDLPFGMVDGRLGGSRVPVESVPGTTLAMQQLSVEQGMIRVRVENPSAASQVLVAEVSTKPLIGFLWAGTLFLGLGCTVAVVRRVRETQPATSEASATARSHGGRAGSHRRPAAAGAARRRAGVTATPR